MRHHYLDNLFPEVEHAVNGPVRLEHVVTGLKVSRLRVVPRTLDDVDLRGTIVSMQGQDGRF